MDIERVHKRLLYMATSIRDVLIKNDIPYILAYGNLLGAVRHQGFIPWDDDFDLFLFDDTYDEAIELLRDNMPSDLFLEDAKSEPLFYHGWARVKDLRTKIQKKISLTTNAYQHQGLDVDLFRLKKMKEDEEQLYRATEHQKYLTRLKRHNLITEEEYTRRIQEVERRIDYEKAKQKKEKKDDNKEIYTFCVIYDDRIYPEDLFPLKEYRFENTSFLGPNNPSPYLTCCYGDYMKLPDPDKRRSHYSDVLFIDEDE